MRPRILSLCSGYGGLDLAVEDVLGAVTVAHAEIEPAACTVLEARWPGVPNIGDIKVAAALHAYRWRGLFEIVTAGYPCQPFSTAGPRKGTDDPRHLWPHVAEAIRRVRPRLVVLENVAGHRTLGFDTVLGDLATLGYDAAWTSLRAADVGAPHGRERVFVVAADARHATGDAEHGQQSRIAPVGAGESDRSPLADTADNGYERRWPARTGRDGSADSRGPAADAVRGQLQRRRGPGAVGGPASACDGEAQQRQRDGHPADDCGSATTDAEDREPGLPQGDDPAALDASATRAGARTGTRGTAAGVQDLGRGAGVEWGPYGPAIERWERVLGRVAPAPTELGPKGGQRLAPRFVEWMMGLPVGWVTDVPGISRNAQLKMLGNGVVPQQAAEAIRRLLPLLADLPECAA